MLIDRIELHNFLSFHDGEFEVGERGLLLVSGKNGGGKSTLTGKAVSWCLFGDTPAGIKADSIISFGKEKDNAYVKCYLTVQGQKWSVLRQRNPTTISVFDSDGKEVQFRDPKQTQVYINTLVGRDFKAFLCADYFGADEKSRFLKATPSAQQSIVEEILRLDQRTGPLSATAKKKFDDLSDQASTLKASAREIQGRISECQAQRDMLISRHRSLAAELNALKSVKPPEDEGNPQELESEIADLKKDRDEWTEKAKAAEERVQEMQRGVNQASLAVASLDRDIQSTKSKVRTITPRECPECHQSVDMAVTERLLNEQKEIKAGLETLLSHFETASSRKKEWEEARDKVQKDLTLAHTVIESRNSKIVNLEAQLSQIRTRQALDTQAIENKQAAVDEVSEAVKEMQGRIGVAQKNFAKATADANNLTSEAKNYDFWADAFRNSFKRFTLQQCLPFLNERVAHHLALLGNPSIEVVFSTTKELKKSTKDAFDVRASTRAGGQNYGSLSGGERQIASFAVGLALSELADAQSGATGEMVILDEPFTELDPNNCANVVNYIQSELLKRKRTVLLISNDPNLRQLINNRVEITKNPDGSSVISEG